MALPPSFRDRLRIPVIAAPMFFMSGPELVIAACQSGIAAALPALNARSSAELDAWLSRMGGMLGNVDERRSGPYGINLIVHRSTRRLEEDLALVVRHRVPFVVTSVGNPKRVAEAVHSYGGVVFHDVTTVEFAERAIQAGVDGLILVCGGAGGHAGQINPFALVPQVRSIFAGTIVLAGAISDGRGIYAARALGADLVYMGTRFNATVESRAPAAFKELLVSGRASDVVYTSAFTGIPANMLKTSIRQAGLDPENLVERRDIKLGSDLDLDGPVWSQILTTGHGIGSIRDIPHVQDLIARLAAEYEGCVASSPRHCEDADRDDIHLRAVRPA